MKNENPRIAGFFRFTKNNKTGFGRCPKTILHDGSEEKANLKIARQTAT
jgi:hypothetical protein